MIIGKNTAFIHMPRTGGTWVRCAVRESMGKQKESGLPKDYGVRTIHHSIKDAKPWLGERFTFCSIRNPLTYLQSRWRRRSFPPIEKHYDLANSKSFKEFIDVYCDKCPQAILKLYSRFTGYPFDGVIRPDMVDRIIRLEDQPWALIEVLCRNNEIFDINKILKEPPRHTAQHNCKKHGQKYNPNETMYTADQITKIIEINKPIYETFYNGWGNYGKK